MFKAFLSSLSISRRSGPSVCVLTFQGDVCQALIISMRTHPQVHTHTHTHTHCHPTHRHYHTHTHTHTHKHHTANQTQGPHTHIHTHTHTHTGTPPTGRHFKSPNRLTSVCCR